MELLDGAAELAAFGADGRALAAVQGKGARVRRRDHPFGIREGSGGGGERARGGRGGVRRAVLRRSRGARRQRSPGVLLAVVVLTPLAAHEVFAGLAPAAQEVPRLRAAAARVADVLRRPAPVAEPVGPGGRYRDRPTTWRSAA